MSQRRKRKTSRYTGVLAQPSNGSVQSLYQRYLALFSFYQIPWQNLPHVEAKRELVARLLQAHEPACYANSVSLDDSDKVNDLLVHLIFAHVPGFRARRKKGATFWTTEQNLLLYSRIERLVEANAQFKWSPAKAAKHLPKDQFQGILAATLERQHRRIVTELRGADRARLESLPDSLERLRNEFPEQWKEWLAFLAGQLSDSDLESTLLSNISFSVLLMDLYLQPSVFWKRFGALLEEMSSASES